MFPILLRFLFYSFLTYWLFVYISVGNWYISLLLYFSVALLQYLSFHLNSKSSVQILHKTYVDMDLQSQLPFKVFYNRVLCYHVFAWIFYPFILFFTLLLKLTGMTNEKI